ncbi:hypothetical protein OAQ44_02870 [Candidatus Pseudothioglobus singularis]|nr:hypothetical protein [Candidatus Pseudothioglobus singularis]
MNTFNLNEIANLKDADYSKISSRVKAFCSTYETAQILTEIVKDERDHVIFKAHAVVDGTIKGTGHANEVEGSNNTNNTSHYEVCETIAVGRALAFIGYSDADNLASYEEIENSKLQESQVALHKATLEVATTYLSRAFKNAIDERDEEKIAECQKDMRGNDPLRQEVNATLEDAHKEFLIERGRRIMEERKYEAKKRVNKNLNG